MTDRSSDDLVGGLPARAITEQEYGAFAAAFETGFGTEARPDDVVVWQRITELDRTVAVFDGEQIVATGTADSLEITVPGGEPVPMAGITAIAVLPTHRRRGLLTGMMRRLLDEAHRRGEPLAGLWASESAIYGRFGFGWAASGANLRVDTHRSAFVTPVALQGQTRLLAADEILDVLPGIYEQARPRTAGMLSRSAARWQAVCHDPEHLRDGASCLFTVVYRDQGYARYRIKEREQAGRATYRLLVDELVAADDEALTALWRYLLDVDLVTQVRASNRPVDDPLPLLLTDPRQAVTGVVDSLWLRILDVPRALAVRRYAIPGSLVLAVRDQLCPWVSGTYLLEARDDRARCAPTSQGAHLTLDAADLAAVYLGGVRPSQLARAGRTSEHQPGALATADALFTAAPAPWCPFVF